MIKESLIKYSFDDLVTTLKAMETLNINYKVTRSIYVNDKKFYTDRIIYTITPIEDKENVD